MLRLSLVLVVVALAGRAAAFEPTGNIVADAMLKTLDAAGFSGARAEVERVADSVILKNPRATGFAAESIIVDSGSIDADNALNAAAITYRTVSIAGAGGAVSSAETVTLSGVKLSGTGTQTGVARLLGDFSGIALTNVSARSAAGEAISLSRLAASGTRADGVMDGALSVEGLVFDLSLFDEPAAGQIRALGFDRLTVGLAAEGAWQPDGRANLRTAALGVDGMGTLTLSGAAVGLTASSIAKLQASAAEFSEVLEVLGAVSLRALTVSFEDDGLTKALLTAAVGRTGQSEGAVTAALLAAARPAIAELGDTAFAADVEAALTAFMTTPGRLTVRAMPTSDVTALQVIGAAMVNRALIPDLLALTITHE
ncbi:MAG: hypothetical protein AAF318_18580 [Pseudomonadota bacterium]